MRNFNLTLHCGSHKVELPQVQAVNTPQHTDTWFPIPHTALINLVEQSLPSYGLTVVGQQHALMKEDHRYFGLYQVQPTEGEVSADYTLVIGLRNSHDKSFPAGLCLGSGVFVCDNLAFSAEVVIGRRHTRFIMDDLPRLIAAALGRLVESRIDQQKRIDAYKMAGITDEQAAHLLFKAFDAKAVTKTQLTDIWGQWNHPDYSDFDADKNVWRLHNAVTAIQRGINPFELQARTTRLHPLLDVAAGVQIGQRSDELEDIIDAEFTVHGQNALAVAA